MKLKRFRGYEISLDKNTKEVFLSRGKLIDKARTACYLMHTRVNYEKLEEDIREVDVIDVGSEIYNSDVTVVKRIINQEPEVWNRGKDIWYTEEAFAFNVGSGRIKITEDTVVEKAFLTPGLYPEISKEFIVNFAYESGNLNTRVISKSNLDGILTRGKLFFPSKDWREDAFVGEAKVSISKEFKSYGFLDGYMYFEKAAEINHILRYLDYTGYNCFQLDGSEVLYSLAFPHYEKDLYYALNVNKENELVSIFVFVKKEALLGYVVVPKLCQMTEEQFNRYVQYSQNLKSLTETYLCDNN